MFLALFLAYGIGIIIDSSFGFSDTPPDQIVVVTLGISASSDVH